MALTALETKVLAALRKNADEVAGGDFGLLGEVRVAGMTRQAFGGVLTSLQEKGYVRVHDAVETNGGPRRGGERHVQFTLARPYEPPDLVTAVKAVLGDLEHYVSTHGPGPDRRLADLKLALAAVESPHVNPYDAGESAQPAAGYKPRQNV